MTDKALMTMLLKEVIATETDSTKQKDLFESHLSSLNKQHLIPYINDYLLLDNLDSNPSDNENFHGDEIILGENIEDTPMRFGWLSSKSNEEIAQEDFIKQTIYKAQISSEAIEQNLTSSKAILGHCNNPNNWETSEKNPYLNDVLPANFWQIENNDYFYKNKQGLVYGMVQSGKTINMLFLTSLAIHNGYNLIIHLSGDKDSLRNQTQDRLNSFFKLEHNLNTNLKIVSLTGERDYPQQTNGMEVLSKFQKFRDNYSIIIVTKKNTNTLNKLNQDLDNLKNNIVDLGIQWSNIKALIIDDEADYGTVNTRQLPNRSTLNRKIIDIRITLSKNSYVAYTATPQACFGASPLEIVGYPSDFIIPIFPLKKNGLNETYVGIEEFYLHDHGLNNIMPEDSWPYYAKDERGIVLGVFNPDSYELNETRLIELEKQWLESLRNDVEGEKSKIFVEATIEFLLSTAILWYRHALKNNILYSDFPELVNLISERNIFKQNKTRSNIPEFPYAGMMINMAFYNDMQTNLKEFFKSISSYIAKILMESDFNEMDGYFGQSYELQLGKSTRFGKPIPDLKNLEIFIKVAFHIAFEKNIYETNEKIYILNSRDPGNTLKYENINPASRPKPAAVIIGGHILGRGLTIQNLLTSIFLRSQASSLADTNLQMCRWFGHKRNQIDLLSVYMQKHNFQLFQEIADCDNELRKIVAANFNEGKSGKCALIELRNSPKFRLTNPSKNRFFQHINGNSYSGRSKHYKSLCGHKDYQNNFHMITDFFQGKSYKIQHNRAFVLYNQPYELIKENLLSKLNLDTREEIGFNLTDIFAYIDKCIENNINYSFNIALFGLSIPDFPTMKVELLNRAVDDTYHVSHFVGGSINDGRESYYAGDTFIDLNQHKELEEKFQGRPNVRKYREREDGILISFYFLDVNYKGKDRLTKEPIFRLPGNPSYKEDNIGTAISVTFPKGGLLYSLSTNILLKSELVTAECADNE